MVSSPSAMALVEPLLVHRPLQVLFQRGMRESMSWTRCWQIFPRRSGCWRSAAAMRWTWASTWPGKRDWPLVMIPTIVSTGAVFQSPLALRREERFEWIMGTVAPEYLLFDYGVIRQAPAHLNCSGMAECICYLGQVGAWKWWLDQGLEAPAWDQGVADEVLDWVDSRVRVFRESLDEGGRPGGSRHQSGGRGQPGAIRPEAAHPRRGAQSGPRLLHHLRVGPRPGTAAWGSGGAGLVDQRLSLRLGVRPDQGAAGGVPHPFSAVRDRMHPARRCWRR